MKNQREFSSRFESLVLDAREKVQARDSCKEKISRASNIRNLKTSLDELGFNYSKFVDKIDTVEFKKVLIKYLSSSGLTLPIGKLSSTLDTQQLTQCCTQLIGQRILNNKFQHSKVKQNKTIGNENLTSNGIDANKLKNWKKHLGQPSIDFIKTPEFLSTPSWKAVRMEALTVLGNKCCCCGKSPATGETVSLHVDHIRPRKLFPQLALDLSNLQILCSDCNFGKGNWNEIDYRTDKQKEAISKFLKKLS